MRKKPGFIFISILIIIIGFCLAIKASHADSYQPAAVSAPIILSTAQIQEGSRNQIQVSGIVSNAEEVLIYLNGNYDGLANISQLDINMAKFSYLSNSISTNTAYEVMAIARDPLTRILSAPTNATVETVIQTSSLKSAQPIEKILPTANIIPAPHLLSPSGTACVSSPYISGYSSSPIVLIYIDNHLLASIPLVHRTPRRSFFNYTPLITLSRGTHSVYAIAQDQHQTVNSSPKSNTLVFCIATPLITATTTKSTLAEQSDNNINSTTPSSTDGLVFQETFPNKTPNNSAKNTLNILIFTLFIVGLIIWMFIVNKELGDETNHDTKH
ncbi:MAG TPA: hypothetical protein VMC41_03435 [Candidatus Nanoarchaeia archaeon]|nr:hypothetical protein [Candidatus Nanoarchaeia archaeon]